MSIMPEYPAEIIPRPDFKLNLDIDILLRKYPRLLVVRMIEGNPSEYYKETEGGQKVLTETVFKSSMANLSMNLAGGLFNTANDAHLRFLPCIEAAIEEWDGNEIPAMLYNSVECYKFYETCYGPCFFVVDIHNKTFPFYRHFESKEERDAYALQVKAASSETQMDYDAQFVGEFLSKKQNILVKPRLKVHHKPTKVNYWHITLDTYRPTDTKLVSPSEKQNNTDRNMFKALKKNLTKCCYTNLNPEYCLKTEDYIIST